MTAVRDFRVDLFLPPAEMSQLSQGESSDLCPRISMDGSCRDVWGVGGDRSVASLRALVYFPLRDTNPVSPTLLGLRDLARMCGPWVMCTKVRSREAPGNIFYLD
jgi:hypothetical protein